MKKMCIIFIIVFLIGVVGANEFGYNYLESGESVSEGGNYSINVNNSQYLQGYTPTTLKDWIQGFFDSIYCELTGCTMSGDIDMDGNDILDVATIESAIYSDDGGDTLFSHNDATGEVYWFKNINMYNNDIHDVGDLNASGNITANDFIIPAMKGNNDYESVNDFFKLFTSAGRLTGGTIVSSGATSVIVTSGNGILRVADDDISQVKFIHWDNSSSISIPTNEIYYFGVEYNGGSPQVINKSIDTWDLDTEFPLGGAINQGGTLEIINNPWWVGDGLTNVIERFQSQGSFVRDEIVGGLILSYTGTRNPTLSAGTLWNRLNEFEISAQDTSGVDTFSYYYQDGSGGYDEYPSQTQWNITHWDDGGVLTPIGNNQYAVIWVWVNAGRNELALIYPQATYSNVASAEAEAVPSTYPSMWYRGGIIVGRIIIKEGVDVPIDIQSAFDISFIPSQATDHGNLAGLTDDDHTQYLIGDGTRVSTYGNISNLQVENNITILGNLCNSSGICYTLNDLNKTGSSSGSGKKGDEIYLFNNTNTMFFNETKLNQTIGSYTSNLTGGGGSSLWTANGSDIYYNSGKVGIGTGDPIADIDITGDTSHTILLDTIANGKSYFRASEKPGSYMGGFMYYDGLTNKLNIGVHNIDDTSTASDIPVLEMIRTGTGATFLKPVTFSDNFIIGAGIEQSTNLIFNDAGDDYNFTIKTRNNEMFKVINSLNAYEDYVSVGGGDCVLGSELCISRQSSIIQDTDVYQSAYLQKTSTYRLTELSNSFIGNFFKYDGLRDVSSIGSHSANSINKSEDINIIEFPRAGTYIDFLKPAYFYGNTSGNPVSVWASSNMSATGYITRTDVWNEEEEGRAIDNFVNFEELLNDDGSINHSAYGSCSVSYEVIDYSKPIFDKNCNPEINDCPASYPYNRTEEGVLMDCLSAKNEQAMSIMRNAFDILDTNETAKPIIKAEKGIATPELYFMSKPYDLEGSGLSKIKDKDEHTYLNGSINYESYGEDNKKIKVKKKVKQKDGSVIEVEEELNLIDAQSRINVLEQAIWEMNNCVETSKDYKDYQTCIIEERVKVK